MSSPYSEFATPDQAAILSEITTDLTLVRNGWYSNYEVPVPDLLLRDSFAPQIPEQRTGFASPSKKFITDVVLELPSGTSNPLYPEVFSSAAVHLTASHRDQSLRRHREWATHALYRVVKRVGEDGTPVPTLEKGFLEDDNPLALVHRKSVNLQSQPIPFTEAATLIAFLAELAAQGRADQLTPAQFQT